MRCNTATLHYFGALYSRIARPFFWEMTLNSVAYGLPPPRQAAQFHTMNTRTDPWFTAADATLRTLFATPRSGRDCPTVPEANGHSAPLSDADKQLSGALMRVNHVGEVCAQALYTAQALGARVFGGDAALAAHMEAAGREETDHLAWTQARLHALNSRPSLLNPLWYAGAFGLGLLASRAGKRVSLGFVVETERQVEAHLISHLDRLPSSDVESRAVVAHMRDDEARHAREAQHAGAANMPLPVKSAMKLAAKLMTAVAHRV